MTSTQPQLIKTITAYHKLMRLAKPEHPLISVINFEDIKHLPGAEPINLVNEFYSIGLKRNFDAKMKYGQHEYDFDEGMMTFMAPGQVLRIEIEKDKELNHSGWLLLVHPDFLWNTPLASTIKKYEYFSYSVNEALHLSEKEETSIKNIIVSIEQEYHSNIDQFSQNLIIAQLEVLLTYAERFYNRQFITRKVVNHQILNRLEEILSDYFKDDYLSKNGLPTVTFFADSLNLSPTYFSGLLKSLIGQSPQQYLHQKLIEKAKEELSTTSLSVSEIAYKLGFEHPQSFSKLFKTKTNLSPMEFRRSFN
ncbi:AraC family transcriptional regulator [Pedobacter sp. KBW06]|uniref:helix-turn-helix domain-containing protein n=1 Tax=Pedobacter sp. KBW06 TaxID=2153359 RepID=UPI000F593706|nr:response regulator transcription factor [Pedobacter sp. KBW06]RQO74353.1 AraC family transcriptional regulator [Pedobacter sp. KBW06]